MRKKTSFIVRPIVLRGNHALVLEKRDVKTFNILNK